nr:uncharacterized protein LOC112210982 [Halyomorpha halys]
MATQKPVEWVSTLITRFEDQLPCRAGPQTTHSRINEEQNQACLIQISRHKFSLVISGLTKILQRVNETYISVNSVPRPHGADIERNCYESLLIVLDTLEQCLSNLPKDTAKFDEAMNVKLLLRELCQFIDSNENPNAVQLKNLATKVLFALSLNFFNAVFNRISARLQELSTCSDENPDYTDIELIQYINVDVLKLTKLMNETILKFRLLKKSVHQVLIVSLERAIWNWLDTYPDEFADVQQKSKGLHKRSTGSTCKRQNHRRDHKRCQNKKKDCVVVFLDVIGAFDNVGHGHIVTFSKSQRGFIKGLPGTHVSARVIDAIIKDAKSRKKDCAVVFLDVVGAFDNVGHGHIVSSLEARGVSSDLTNVIAALLTTNKIKITIGTHTTSQINVLRGVPQGGPLSPSLFNLAIDHLYRELCDQEFANKFGYDLKSDQESVVLTGFADDQAVTARDRGSAERIINGVQRLLAEIGLNWEEKCGYRNRQRRAAVNKDLP